MSFALDWVMNNAEKTQNRSCVILPLLKSETYGDYQRISKLEAFKSYRIMGMLSKIATIARNLTSNMVTDPLTTLSRDMVVPIDMLLSKITGTRSVSLDKSWLSSAKRLT